MKNDDATLCYDTLNNFSKAYKELAKFMKAQNKPGMTTNREYQDLLDVTHVMVKETTQYMEKHLECVKEIMRPYHLSKNNEVMH